MNAAKQELARLVERSRREKGLTQAQLAEKVPMGVSTLRQIEDGKAEGPSLFTILAILNALDIDPGRLDTVGRRLRSRRSVESRAKRYRGRSHPRQLRVDRHGDEAGEP